MKSEKSKPDSKPQANAASQKPTPAAAPQPAPTPAPVSYPDVPTNDWIDAVIKNDPEFAGSVLLHGYLGKSSDDSSVDLYSDASLNKKVSIKKEHIIHVQKIQAANGSVEGSHVWVKKDGDYTFTVGANDAKARFLQGDIYSDYLRNTGAGTAPAGIPTTTAAVACPTICGNLTDQNGTPANANTIFPTVMGCMPTIIICAAAAGNDATPNTAATTCTQIGCAPHISLPGCVQQTHLLGCTTATGTPTALLGCQTATSTPTQLLGCGGATGTPTANTMATVCTQIACPQTQLLGCTTATATPGGYDANNTIATVCTQIGCMPTQLLGCQTATSTPTQLLGCGGATGTPTAMLGCQTATSTPTHLLGCGGATGTPTTPAANTIFPSLACTVITVTHQGGIATIATITVAFDAQGNPVGPTGWHTCMAPTHLLGCTTATGTPTALLGCQTATSTPTHLMGCTTVTSTPTVANANLSFPTLQCTIPAICLVTALAGCNAAAPQQIGQTGWLGCHPAQNTAATVCTQIGCTPTALLGCQTATSTPTHLMGCTGVTATPQQVGPTGWLGCGQTNMPGCTGVTATPQQVGPTGWWGCGQTNMPGCTGATATPTALFGCTGATGTPTAMLGCQTATSTPTQLFGCGGATGTPTTPAANTIFPTLTITITITGAAAPQQVGPTGWQTCLAPTQLLGCGGATGTPTAMLGCQTATSTPTHLMGCTGVTATPQQVGPTGWLGCGQTNMPGCTGVTATPQQVGPTGWLGCGQTNMPGCTGATGTPTALLGCQTATSTPTHLMGCTTVTSTPTVANANLSFPTLQCTIIPIACIVTAAAGCNAAAPQQVGPTGWLGCGQTNMPGCTGATGTPTAMLGCQTATSTPTHLMGCTGVTATPQQVGPTGWLGCGQTNMPGCTGATGTPTAMLGCQTATSTPTHLMGCTGVTATPQQVGPTGWLGCGQTNMPGCTGVTATPHVNAAQPLTSAPGLPTMNSFCIPTIVPFCMMTQPAQCPATLPAGCMPQGGNAANANAATPNANTIGMPTQYGVCPTLGFTCTYINCDIPTINCPAPKADAAPQTIGVTGWLGCMHTANPAQCLMSIPANCPTVANCPAAPQANAAIPTIPAAACATQATTVIVPTLNCGIPSIPGCIPTAHCTGIPWVC